MCNCSLEGNRLRKKERASSRSHNSILHLEPASEQLPSPYPRKRPRLRWQKDMPRVTSPWPTLVGMRTLRQRKGKELNNSHTTAEVDLEPLASHFLVRGCFSWALWPCCPNNVPPPPAPPCWGHHYHWPSRAFPFLVPVCAW